MIDFLRQSVSHIFVNDLTDVLELDGDVFHHLANVLRVNKSDSISAACNGDVRNYEVAEVSQKSITLNAISEVLNIDENEIHLCISLFKMDRLEWGISKAIETGATSITIGTTSRSTFSIDKKKRDKVQARLNALAESACSQSRRPRLVKVTLVDSLLDHIKHQDASLIVCEPGGQRHPEISFPVVVAIGPEGGFSQSELNDLGSSAVLLELSPNILRAETAMAVAPSRINLS